MTLGSLLCNTLLRFRCAQKVGVTERSDDILVIVEEFIEHAVVAPHVEKHDNVLLGAAAFAMDIARWAGLVHAGGADLLERAIGFVKAMLALHDECVVVDHMPMQNDFLVCRKFEQYMYIMVLFVDVKHSKMQVL